MKNFLVECLFYSVCGWVGHTVVRLCSLGRIRLDWGSDSESCLTEAIGAIFLLGLGLVLLWLLR
jgi:hypothetical protein